MRQIDLAITTLADLRQDLKVVLAETRATLAQMSALATEIFAECGFVFFDRSIGRVGVCGPELGLAVPTVMNVAKEIKIVVEEVWYGGSTVSPYDLGKGCKN